MKAAFEKMIIENKFLILRICHFYYSRNQKELIENLYQEILFNLWKSYPKFIRNQKCKTSTWLYRVALNTTLLQKRNESKMVYVPLNEEMLNTTNNDDFLINVLYELIEKLDREEKNIIYLYLEDLSHKEIAEILGISVSNVGTKIHRIKSKLKALNKK